MKSKAAIGSHPIHPMLIAFPVSFLTGAVGFDIASRVTTSEALYTTAQHCLLTGIVTGLVAAVPGLVDFMTIIPSNSRAKRKARAHMIVNISALILFAISLFVRPMFVDRTVVSMLPAYLGLVTMMIGGWLGGSLVYEERIGVNEPITTPPASREAGWESTSEEYGVHTHH